MMVDEIKEIEIIMELCEETSINQKFEIESLQEVQPNADMVETVYKTIENTMVPKLKKKLYFPFIPGPSSNYSAIYTALKLSQGISHNW